MWPIGLTQKRVSFCELARFAFIQLVTLYPRCRGLSNWQNQNHNPSLVLGLVRVGSIDGHISSVTVMPSD